MTAATALDDLRADLTNLKQTVTALTEAARLGATLATTVAAIADDQHRDPWLLLDGVKAAVEQYDRAVADLTGGGDQ